MRKSETEVNLGSLIVVQVPEDYYFFLNQLFSVITLGLEVARSDERVLVLADGRGVPEAATLRVVPRGEQACGRVVLPPEVRGDKAVVAPPGEDRCEIRS